MLILFSSIEVIEDGEVERLVLKSSEGSKEALSDLYEKTKDSMFAFILSYVKNIHDAEDILHDLYIRVWSQAKNYQAQGKPLAWLFTIAKNLCLSKLRKSSLSSDIPQEDWEQYIDAKESLPLEDKLVLKTCLKGLTDEEYRIIELHAVVGMKHREIANLMDMPLSTVLSKYNRTLKKLKALLEKEGVYCED